MELAILVGNIIRDRRTAVGASQDRLAQECGLDRSYMGRIERGEVNVTIATLYRIARALHCSAHDLLPKNEIDEIG